MDRNKVDKMKIGKWNRRSKDNSEGGRGEGIR